MQLLKSLAVLVGCAATLASAGASDAFRRVERVKLEHQHKHHARQASPVLREFTKRSSPYLNKDSQKFVVNPFGIPQVPFSIGESYAGLLPISDKKNETRQLFFWFFPSQNPAAKDEITIWLNGGPGCSSLSGMLTENGPFTWMPGTKAPVPNAYSWSNLTNMVWVEQPVGVGYSTGIPNIKNEVELAQEFMGFWKNFMKTFKLQNRKVYVTGESYGGFYVPYIANAFIESGDPTYYNVKGVAINDPIIAGSTLQQEVPVIPYMQNWNQIMNLNDTFVKEIMAANEKCGYVDYYNKYLQFPPPPGPFPDPKNAFSTPHCDMFDTVFAAALEVNPCFNIYHIMDTCPHLYGVLGIVNRGDYSPPGAEVYFNRKDVRKAINAPMSRTWYQCEPFTVRNVFGAAAGPGQPRKSGRDESPGPATNGVLANVIEKTNNTIIGVGELDFLLPVNGTLLAIQNMTWNGAQGLSSYPTKPFYVPYHPEFNGGSLAGAGNLGAWTSDRGLTFYTVRLAGHMVPEYCQGCGYRFLEKLLGRIPDLSSTEDFTTQSGVFTGKGTIFRR